MTEISLCVIFRNEERHMKEFLEHHAGLFEETVFVDTGSTDRSCEILRQAGYAPLAFSWCNDFSAARNFALQHATRSFLMTMDLDERILPQDLARLKNIMAKSDDDGYSLKLINLCNNPDTPDWHTAADLPPEFRNLAGGYIPTSVIRVFRNLPQVRYRGRIHEIVGDSLRDNNLTSMLTDIPVYHFGWLETARSEQEQLEKKTLYREMIRMNWEEEHSPQAAWYYLSALTDPREKAETAYRFSRRFPEVKEFHIALAQAAVDLSQWPRALNYAEKGLQLFPNSPQLQAIAALGLNETGRAGDALVILDHLLAIDPLHPRYAAEKLRALLLLGKRTEALAFLSTLPLTLQRILQKLLAAREQSGSSSTASS